MTISGSVPVPMNPMYSLTSSESDELLGAVLKQVSDGIFVIDAASKRFLVTNPSFREMLGYTGEELASMAIYDVLPYERDRIDRAINRAREEGKYRVSDRNYRRKDGTLVCVEVNISPIKFRGSEALCEVVRDITERRRVEETLLTRARQSAAVAAFGQRALEGMDLQELMQDAAELVAGTLGMEYSKVLELLPGREQLLLRAGVGWREGWVGHATIGTGLNSQAGYSLRSDHPVVVEDLPAETRFKGEPLLMEHGVISGMSVIIHGRNGPFGVLGTHTTRRALFSEDDVNFLQAIANVLAAAIERARVEEDRAALLVSEQAARASLEQALRTRDEMLAVVSHDLRTPITIIKGNAQLLRRRMASLDSPQLTKQANLLAAIEETSSKMDLIVKELVDFARIQEGRPLSLQRQPTDLVALVHRVAGQHQQLVDAGPAGHRIDFYVEQPVISGNWDPGRLERVITNLLSNAIKYSPSGSGIEIRAWMDEEAQGGPWAVLSVRDHGVGIPAVDLPHIFDWFRRATNVSKRFSGAGIGLASTRSIVEQHGGSISVESIEGDGTEFVVRLPVNPPPEPGTPSPGEPAKPEEAEY